MLTLEHYLIVAAMLFTIGIISVISRKNAIGILIGIELILNAVNLNLIAFSKFSAKELDGQVFAIFVIILAACEAAVALAIFINLFANFGSIDVDEPKHMKR
jgi:NADH-quinone oxidoreductase subunit K